MSPYRVCSVTTSENSSILTHVSFSLNVVFPFASRTLTCPRTMAKPSVLFTPLWHCLNPPMQSQTIAALLGWSSEHHRSSQLMSHLRHQHPHIPPSPVWYWSLLRSPMCVRVLCPNRYGTSDHKISPLSTHVFLRYTHEYINASTYPPNMLLFLDMFVLMRTIFYILHDNQLHTTEQIYEPSISPCNEWESHPDGNCGKWSTSWSPR